MSHRVSLLAGLVLGVAFTGCGGGGGGGGGNSGNVGSDDTGGTSAVAASKADLPTRTFATTGRNGAWSQLDVVPIFQGNPDLGSAPSASQQSLLNQLQTLSGTDLSGNWTGPSPTLPTAGFDTYLTGLSPGSLAGYILAANNVYDLLQTTTGTAQDGFTLPIEFTASTFPGFTGGDIDSGLPTGDDGSEGGPGLFSNFPLASLSPGRAVPPQLPPIPNTMGGIAGTSGRGPSADDEHQFVQLDFSYTLDRDSLFNDGLSDNSFLGDTNPAMGTGNVNIVRHSVQHPPLDEVNAVDQLPVHVTGIAVIGGVTAIPTGLPLDQPQQAFFDPDHSTFNRMPFGATELLMDPSVFTYIAYESPSTIQTLSYPQAASSDAYIVNELGIDGDGTNAGMLVLPSPTNGGGQGGRVFGAEAPEVGSVNDFDTDGDETAAAVGFLSIEFEWLRTGGELVSAPYFHSFAMDQQNVGADTRAINGSFNRGAAITVNTAQVPSIDILDPSTDALGSYDPQPSSDSVNTISTRARFRIDFDREVVPNSVGFSRRHTLHSVPSLGEVFPFNGNTRPVSNPIGQFTGAAASPLAASIYLAVNQPAGINQANGLLQPVASAYQIMGAPNVNAAGNFLADNGVTQVDAEANALTPEAQNQLATLPRAIVPVDIYPLNQNNLQSYVVEPLIELPPGSIVTLGVTMNGLGTTYYGMVNHGNHTRAGTMFTPYQALNLTNGLGDDASVKQAVLANNTIVKVNAGPMTLDGLLFYGGTNVALHRKVNQNPDGPDDQTTGNYNTSRTFQVGTDNDKRYINAPVSPQAIYMAFTTGGAGVLDLAGNGYTTNAPQGGLANTPYKFYLETSRFLPAGTQTPGLTSFNWVQGGSALSGDHRQAFGILGRYTSGNNLSGNIESDFAVGAPVKTGNQTDQPGVNEGSSGYETLVRSGILQGDPATSTAVLAPVEKVGIVTDIEVGDFLDTIYFDPENPWTLNGHKTYNTPQQGTLDNNTIADPPTPNPPPLRYPVGLPHTAVLFDQSNLVEPPVLIEGNEVFPADSFFAFASGPFITGAPQPVNGLLFLNPVQNESNTTQADLPQLPNIGFTNPFNGLTTVTNPAYVQTGPSPKTSTGTAALLASINLQNGPGFANPSGLSAPFYQSRQQIGNFLFLADQTNNKVHALNSNTMDILHSVKLPDPRGLGLTADLRKLFVSNEGDASVSIIDADPTSPTFMTELKRTKVGIGPRAVACNPDGEDVFVLNYSANTVSILNQTTGNVRKTLISNGINRPYDIAVGMREYVGGPGFQSGTYHAYISNFGGNNVLVYEGGPDGLAGIGFDNIIAEVDSDTPSDDGQVWRNMRSPRGITFDPNAPLDGFSLSIGCYVAHQDSQGRALVSRITYSKDSAPGQQVFNTTFFNPFNGDKTFEVRSQYVSAFSGVAFDVVLPDYNRRRYENEDFGSYYNLLNAGATSKTQPQVDRNCASFPLADNLLPFQADGPRWEPDRLYFSVGGSNAQKLIEVFDLITGQHLKSITTPAQVGVMSSYFSQ